MELRAVLLFTGCYILRGYKTDGTQTFHYVGAAGPLTMVASQGNLLAANSNGGMTYNATNHDPF